jgi:hypothetical protein
MVRFASVALVLAAAGAAQAQVLNVGPTTIVPGFGTAWYSTGNSGGGSSGITSYIGIDGDGAAQIRGDRTRFAIGNIFPSNSSPLPNVGLLSDVTAFSYQWNTVAVGSGVVTAQAPALRMHVLDPVNNRRIEFIWEDGEQSTPQFVGGAGTLGTVYSGNFFTGRVYANTGGLGRGLFDGGGAMISGSDAALPFSNLISILGVPSATVAGVSVGVGSSVGADFLGYADTVTLQFGTNPALQMNFVPTPGAAALLGLAGLAATRRRR